MILKILTGDFIKMLSGIIERINSVMWGEFTIILIVACGIYHTIKSGFVQFRLPSLVKDKGGKKRMKAVTSALAASMGTGNITGCAAAIAVGGAGAVFWMWASAFAGMALAYSENRIGAEFAEKYPNLPKGPMLYIEKGLGSKLLAKIYAAGCLCAAFAMGCMSQSGAFSEALGAQTGAPVWVFSLLLGIITAAVVFSSKRASDGIMSAAEKIVPIMGIVYAVGCISLLIVTKADVAGAFVEIFSCAFTPKAAAGGAAGIAIKKTVTTGLRRGVFSNEAGMGSSVLVHSDADFGSPESAGAWAALEVFLDTMVCCTLTALTVLTSKGYRQGGSYGITEIFSEGLGTFGGLLCCASVCMFAWAAVLGWCCYGEKCLDYLFPRRKSAKGYKLLFCGAAVLGGLISSEAALSAADLFNVFIMFPNLFAITVILSEKGLDKIR